MSFAVSVLSVTNKSTRNVRPTHPCGPTGLTRGDNPKRLLRQDVDISYPHQIPLRSCAATWKIQGTAMRISARNIFFSSCPLRQTELTAGFSYARRP